MLRGSPRNRAHCRAKPWVWGVLRNPQDSSGILRNPEEPCETLWETQDPQESWGTVGGSGILRNPEEPCETLLGATQ